MDLQFASAEMNGDKKVVLAAVAVNRRALEYASQELKGDKEVVLAAVNQNGYALRYASEELKGDKKVVLAAVNENGNAFECASEKLKRDKEVVLAAVNQNGYALRYASEELKGGKEVVLAAVNQSGRALKFSLPALRNGGLQTYVLGLLNAYTVPPSVFLGIILCSTKYPSVLAANADDTFARSLAGEVDEEDVRSLIARHTRSRTEASRTCVLPKLNLGDDTTVFLMKKIAAFAGVQCHSVCGVPWSHVVNVARRLKVRTQD